jgi:hypothetical protein
MQIASDLLCTVHVCNVWFVRKNERYRLFGCGASRLPGSLAAAMLCVAGKCLSPNTARYHESMEKIKRF